MRNRIADRSHAAGDHRLTWMGTNSQGARVPSGTYFAHMKSGTEVVTRKLALIK